MCGIVGYIGSNEKKQILLDGLKELEYRGYDSAGIAVLAHKQLHNFKSVGKIANLEEKCKDFSSQGFGLGIGHTRWATHGKPTEANAHPHFAEFSNVVHNGIIENYAQIKQALKDKGHQFTSQTDTEVIVHLFEENLKTHKDPMEAFKHTIQALSGAYAILLITKADEEAIFYAKKGSPLIIAQGEGGVYFTLILRPAKADLCAQSLSRQAAQAVAEALAQAYGIKTKVKLPNEVLAWDGKTRQWKQIAAVLTETFFEENSRFALLGVGVNVNNRLTGSAKAKSVSLKQLIGMETSKEVALDEILTSFWKHYAHWTYSAQ